MENETISIFVAINERYYLNLCKIYFKFVKSHCAWFSGCQNVLLSSPLYQGVFQLRVGLKLVFFLGPAVSPRVTVLFFC